MKADIKLYTNPLTAADFSAELSGMSVAEETEAAFKVNYTKLDRAIAAAVKKQVNSGKEGSLDVDLAEPVYETLKGLPDYIAMDMGLWHYLCVRKYPEFVAKRWLKQGIPNTMEEVEENIGLFPAKRKRFLGTNTLAGFAQNTFSRLFFAGRALHSTKHGYKLVNAVFKNQDRQQSIFERKFGLLPNAATALTEISQKGDGKLIKEKAKKLNHIATTIDLDLLTVNEIKDLIR